MGTFSQGSVVQRNLKAREGAQVNTHVNSSFSLRLCGVRKYIWLNKTVPGERPEAVRVVQERTRRYSVPPLIKSFQCKMAEGSMKEVFVVPWRPDGAPATIILIVELARTSLILRVVIQVFLGSSPPSAGVGSRTTHHRRTADVLKTNVEASFLDSPIRKLISCIRNK